VADPETRDKIFFFFFPVNISKSLSSNTNASYKSYPHIVNYSYTLILSNFLTVNNIKILEMQLQKSTTFIYLIVFLYQKSTFWTAVSYTVYNSKNYIVVRFGNWTWLTKIITEWDSYPHPMSLTEDDFDRW
jgi:hypothetical protein